MANNEEWPSETRYIETYQAPEIQKPSLFSQVTDFFKTTAENVIEQVQIAMPKVIGAVFGNPALPEQYQVNPPPETRFIPIYQQTKNMTPYNPVTKGGYEPKPQVTFNFADLFKTPLIWVILGVGLFLIILTQRR